MARGIQYTLSAKLQGALEDLGAQHAEYTYKAQLPEAFAASPSVLGDVLKTATTLLTMHQSEHGEYTFLVDVKPAVREVYTEVLVTMKRTKTETVAE